MAGTTTPDLDLEVAVETDLGLESTWQVVLLDDDDHTYDYVVEMLVETFGHPADLAFKMTVEVDSTGRVVVDVCSKKEAEDGRDKIHAYGADWRLARSQGSMSAVIEPVE